MRVAARIAQTIQSGAGAASRQNYPGWKCCPGYDHRLVTSSLIALLLGLLCGFIGSIPAGPTGALVFERGLAGRTREALLIGAGASVAESLYAVLAFLGFAAAAARFHWLLPASRIAGAVLLFGLGFWFALGPGKSGAKHPPRAAKASGSSLLLGFAVTLSNPTLLVTWSATVTILHGTAGMPSDASSAIPFAAGVLLGICGWFGLLVWLLHRYRDRFRPETRDRVIRVLGWFLVALGVWMVVGFFRGRS